MFDSNAGSVMQEVARSALVALVALDANASFVGASATRMSWKSSVPRTRAPTLGTRRGYAGSFVQLVLERRTPEHISDLGTATRVVPTELTGDQPRHEEIGGSRSRSATPAVAFTRRICRSSSMNSFGGSREAYGKLRAVPDSSRGWRRTA
jgi:hypothetical protein